MKPTPDMVEINGEYYAKYHPEAIAHRQAKPVAELCAPQSKPDNRGQSEVGRVEAGSGRIQYRITFTVYRKRLLDRGDNDRSALKATRDSVTDFLGFTNDNDPRLVWEYHQIKSPRDSGTHILIESESS